MRLGVDVGTVRVGVAASAPDGLMAVPVGTVLLSPKAVKEVAALVADRSATEVFVGLPRTLKGREGTSAADARDFAAQLAELTPATVRLIDERFSTASASRQMSAAGRSAKAQRQVIDQAAAVVILETALEVQKRDNLGSVTTEVPSSKGNDD